VKHCTRCGIDTSEPSGVCVDCVDVLSDMEGETSRQARRPAERKIEPRNSMKRQERDLRIFRDWTNRIPLRDTAKSLKVSQSTVRRLWEQFGLRPLSKVKSAEIDDTIRSMHADGWTQSGIAASLGKSRETVRVRMKRLGLIEENVPPLRHEALELVESGVSVSEVASRLFLDRYTVYRYIRDSGSLTPRNKRWSQLEPRILEMRKRGMLQREIAKELGIPRTTVTRKLKEMKNLTT
jgi:DNA invertase Pin-like site-specific DNA recombinase